MECEVKHKDELSNRRSSSEINIEVRQLKTLSLHAPLQPNAGDNQTAISTISSPEYDCFFKYTLVPELAFLLYFN